MTDHTPPTDTQLDEYEAVTNAASPGPWSHTDSGAIVAPLTQQHIADAWEPTAATRNGDFIEAARDAMPALLAEVRRLRATPAALPSIHANDVEGFCPACGHGVLMIGDGGHVVCTLMDCPRPEAADELLRNAAVPSAVDRAAAERLSRVLEWASSEAVTAKTEFGNGYRECQRDIRDLIRGRFDNDAANELRRMVDEAEREEPVRCPLCADARVLDSPAEAREHFTTVHPEERLVGSGPWPLLANRADEAQQQQPRRVKVRVVAVTKSPALLDTPDDEIAALCADEAQQPETQAHPPTNTWKVESPRRDQWASWGATYDDREWASERYESAIEHAPGRPFRLVRATTTYTVEAEHAPAVVESGKEA